MYLPPHFHETNAEAIKEIIETNPLACIIAQTDSGLVANHIPLFKTAADTLLGHIALANDMHRLLPDGQDVLAVFRGEDGYVSPNFYPSKRVHQRHVPTWNYQVVHVHGKISFSFDEHSKRVVVGLLTRRHERRLNGAAAWKMADAPVEYMTAMLSNIVAFRIEITGILAKSKLSQNREFDDMRGAISGLKSSGKTALADRMIPRAHPGE
jgi:transcriptional regulator